MFIVLISHVLKKDAPFGGIVSFSARIVPNEDLESLNDFQDSLDEELGKRIPPEASRMSGIFDVEQNESIRILLHALPSSGKEDVERFLSEFANSIYCGGMRDVITKP